MHPALCAAAVLACALGAWWALLTLADLAERITR